jgi:hypothetical protein
MVHVTLNLGLLKLSIPTLSSTLTSPRLTDFLEVNPRRLPTSKSLFEVPRMAQLGGEMHVDFVILRRRGTMMGLQDNPSETAVQAYLTPLSRYSGALRLELKSDVCVKSVVLAFETSYYYRHPYP